MADPGPTRNREGEHVNYWLTLSGWLRRGDAGVGAGRAAIIRLPLRQNRFTVGGTMQLDFTTLTAREAYQVMITAITPRPIAWVSTISADGRTNLAPFSFFNGVCACPPTLMFSVANHHDGKKKDTVRNLEAVPECVVNLVSFAQADPMNACAALLPYGESEFETFGIAAAPSVAVRPPRVAAAPVAFECALYRIVPIGEGPLAANVVFARILRVHVSDTVLGADGKLDPAKLDLIGRLGGESYCRTRETFALKRPDR